MHLIFFGPEGSGKGTQAKLLAKKFNLAVLTSGDLVRKAAVEDKGLIGEACRWAISEGKYVPDSEMFVLWKNKIKQKEMSKDWIMDGFPRNVNQAKFLDRKLAKYGYKVEKVIHLKISKKESMRRLLKRGRPIHEGSNELHDSPERIRNRLNTYYRLEKKVLDYYTQKGILEEINGERPIQKVHQEIILRVSKK